MKKNKKIIIAVLAVVVTAIVGTVLAYLLSNGSKENKLTVGKNNVQVSEEFSTPEKQTSDTKYPKSVKIFNTGEIDTYIRVYADFSDSFVRSNSKFSDDGGTTYHSADRTDETDNVAIDNAAANFVTYLNRKNRDSGGKWVFVPDNDSNKKLAGYYYYTEPVAPGGSTDYLFTNVETIYEDADKIRQYDLVVYSESMQITNKDGEMYTDYRAAWNDFVS